MDGFLCLGMKKYTSGGIINGSQSPKSAPRRTRKEIMVRDTSMPINLLITQKPISTNALYRGRRFSTPEGKAYKELVGWEVRKQYKEKPRTGNIALLIDFYLQDKRPHDLDNLLKGLFDSLTGIIYEDDNQITEMHVYKKLDKVSPRVTIHITEV